MFLKLDERLERRENQSHYRLEISCETTACSCLTFGSVPNVILCQAFRIQKIIVAKTVAEFWLGFSVGYNST